MTRSFVPGTRAPAALIRGIGHGLAAAVCLATGATAASSEQAIHAVVFVDVIPNDKEAGSALLTAFARRARQDRDLRSIVLIEQDAIPNHFILEESFPDRAAYNRFAREDYVRSFRAALFPHLGSPWDERLGIAMPAGAIDPIGSGG